jgi:hypothetical protein
MKLHEIELFSKDRGVAALFYSGILGLMIHTNDAQLKAFGAGLTRLNLNRSLLV